MRRLNILIFCLLCSSLCHGQNFLDKLTDIFEFEFGKEKKDTTLYRSKMVLAPVTAYEPNTSWQFGVGTKVLFKFGKSGLDTRTSNLPASITYTLRNQYIVASDYNFFTNHENYLIKGRNHFLKYPISYYGSGIFLPDGEKIEVELYNVLFEPLFMKRIYKKWFVGGGIRYNVNWGERLAESEVRTEASDIILGELGTASTGLEFASTIDSRDNILNALHGHLIEFTHGVYDKSLGGTNNFGISRLDARTYYKVSEHNLNVVAFQLFSRFTWGKTPLTELSTLGGRDLLRGFPEGRFSNKHAIFLQPEFRWQTLDLLGMVFYAGAGDVFSDINEFSFNNMKYSLGTGLRLKIVKSENLNIRFDWGIGFGPNTKAESNFYFGIAEAF